MKSALSHQHSLCSSLMLKHFQGLLWSCLNSNVKPLNQKTLLVFSESFVFPFQFNSPTLRQFVCFQFQNIYQKLWLLFGSNLCLRQFFLHTVSLAYPISLSNNMCLQINYITLCLRKFVLVIISVLLLFFQITFQN